MPGVVAEALHVRAELEDDPVRAEELHHEALVIRAEHGLRLGCVHSLEALAGLAGDTAEAARLVGACDRAREESGHPRLHSGLSGSAEGRSMTLDEAIAYARRSRGTRSRPATGWASLTPTEQSVVTLAVEGLSNPDIGRRLFMSRATVKTQLSHVYAKLGVANRTELATVTGLQPGGRSTAR